MKLNIISKLVVLLPGILVMMNMDTFSQDALNDYLTIAAENNPGLQSKFGSYMAALEKSSQVNALPDPELAFGYFIQPVETRVGPQRFRLSARQMFPWFGTLNVQEDLAIQEAKVKYEEFEEARSALFNEVRATYFDLYFNRKALDIMIENIEILNTFERMALIRVEAGTTSQIDQYRIEMEIGDLENQLARLRDQQSYLEVAFRNLLNTDIESVEVPGLLWESDMPLTRRNIMDSILSRNPKLIGLELQKEAMMIRQDLARKEGSPGVSLGLDYIIVGKGENDLSGKDAFIFPNIGLRLPLYRKKYKSMIAEAAYLEVAKEQEKINTVNMLESLFEHTWNEYADADRRITLYISQLALADKSIELLETEYLTGDESFEEVLRMERKQLFYALELERARADKQAAISFMDYLMGR